MRIMNILSRYLAGALLAMAAGTLIACGPGASDKELVESAKSYMAENQLAEATIELKNALQSNPDNAEARYLLGGVYMQFGDAASAEKEYRRAAELGWDTENAVIGMTRAQIAQNKFQDVIESTNVTDGWSKTAQANLRALEAQAHGGSGDVLKAKSIVLSAETLDADAYDVLKTAFLLQMTEKQYGDANNTLTKALKLFPEDAELMLLGTSLLIQDKKYEEAIGEYQKIIDSEPEKVMTLHKKRAYLGLLKLAVLQKNFELVEKARSAFIANKVEDPEVNYLLAVAAYSEKNYDQAEEYLQKILKVATGHGPTLLLSGSVSFAKKDYEKAAYYLSKYVANYPENHKARKLLGRAYMALGQNDDAQAQFNAILDENVEDAEIIALVGLSEISEGEVGSGIAGLEKALTMASDSSSLKLQLAKAYIADGQTDKAIKQLDEVLETGGDKLQINSLKVLAYLQGKNTDLAMLTAEQMLAESPDNPDVLSLMGSVQFAAKDISAARRYFERALEVNAGHIDSALKLARLDEQQGDLDAAKKHYLSILDKQPENVAVMASLARLAVRQGDESSQIKWLEEARKADKEELLSRVKLVEIYLKNENIANAEIIVRELEEAHPEAPIVLAAKGRLLMAQKRFTQAEAVISKLIDAIPEQDLGYYMQALNQLALGNKVVALEHVRKAYSLKPANLRNVILLARVELSTGNHDRAMKLAEEIIAATPDSATGYLLKGDALLSIKKNQQALTNYDKAWSYEQSRDIVLRRFGATRRLSNVEKAAPVLTSWIEQQPDDAVAMRELANAYLVEKLNKKAEIYLEKILVLQPDNADALNDLAWLYGLENNPRALELAKKAYTLKPQSPGITDTYGWILFKDEKIAEALTLLKEAADKLPDEPEVQYHYAKALFSAGDMAAAKKILKPLIESGQAFDGRADAEKMLTE